MQPVRRDLIKEFVERVTAEGGKMPPLVMVGVDGIPLWAQPFVFISFLAKGFVLKPPSFDCEFEITDFEKLDGYEFQIVRVRVCGMPESPNEFSTPEVTGIQTKSHSVIPHCEVSAPNKSSWWQSFVKSFRGKR